MASWVLFGGILLAGFLVGQVAALISFFGLFRKNSGVEDVEFSPPLVPQHDMLASLTGRAPTPANASGWKSRHPSAGDYTSSQQAEMFKH